MQARVYLLQALILLSVLRGSEAQAESSQGRSRTYTQRAPATPGQRLRLEAKNADIVVTGSSIDEILIEAIVEISGATDADVEAYYHATSLVLTPDGAGFRARLETPQFEEHEDEPGRLHGESLLQERQP